MYITLTDSDLVFRKTNDFEFRGRSHIMRCLGGMVLTMGRPGNEASYYPCCERSRSWTELVPACRSISVFPVCDTESKLCRKDQGTKLGKKARISESR